MTKEAAEEAKANGRTITPPIIPVGPVRQHSPVEDLANELGILRSIQAAAQVAGPKQDNETAELVSEQSFSLPQGSFKVSKKPVRAGQVRQTPFK
jgi:hypothetical protein